MECPATTRTSSRPATASTDGSGRTRRTVLAGVGGLAAAVAGGGVASAADPELPRTVIVPAVSEFEGSYVGQFLTVYEPTQETDASPAEVHEACQELPWPESATAANVGQLTDRLSDQPLAVRVPVYVDSRQTDLVEDALFVINNAERCQGEYVRLDVEWVTTRSVAGKPPGPTVADDEAALAETEGEDGPGFGLATAGLGVGSAIVLWALGKLE